MIEAGNLYNLSFQKLESFLSGNPIAPNHQESVNNEN